MPREDVVWFAGLFEGEGWFRFCPKGRRSMGIAVKMTDRDVLEKVQAKFGGWIWDGAKRYKPQHKQSHQWHLDKRDQAYAVLAAIYSFLGQRRQGQIAKWISQYKALTPIPPAPMIHGRTGSYTRGCRCAECKAAIAGYHRNRPRAVTVRTITLSQSSPT